jgi:hypothetical protein
MAASAPKKPRSTVYALSPSENPNTVRYIGQTSKTLDERLSQHKSTSASTPVALWIRSEIAKGHSIIIQALEKNAPLNDAEVRWIALFKGSGAKLLNCNRGGAGGCFARTKPPKILDPAKPVIAPAAWPFPTSSRP